MPYDLNDPNLDFAGQAEILARALKQSQLLQNTEADPGVRAGHMFVRSSPLSGLGAALSRGAGQYNQSQAEDKQTALNKEQLRRYDELTRQMSTPQEGSTPEAENQRQMGIGSQLGKLTLPMAQYQAQQAIKSGMAFPEAMATLKMKQEETGAQNAMRLQAQARLAKEAEAGRNERAAQHNALLLTMKQMGRASGGGGSEFGGSAPVIGADEQGNPIYRHNKSGALFQYGDIGQPVPYKGTVGAKPMADKPLTEAQGNAMLYGTRAAQAHNVLEDVGTSYSPININIARAAENIPGGFTAANSLLLSPADQKIDQAQRNFINAILRKESGAAINQGEFDNARLQYFPQQGDKPAVLAQKKANRELAIQGLGIMSGPKGDAAVKAEQANKPTATGAYKDAGKEQRYQEWLARQPK